MAMRLGDSKDDRSDQLLKLSQQILQLTDEIHRVTVAHGVVQPGSAGGTSDTPGPIGQGRT